NDAIELLAELRARWALAHGNERRAAALGELRQGLRARKLAPRREEIEQCHVLEVARLVVHEPGNERRDADASGDPYLAARGFTLEAAVRPVKLGVHARRGPRDQLAGVVAERTNQQMRSAVVRIGRDGEGVRLAQAVLFHAEEPELPCFERQRPCDRLELEVYRLRAGRYGGDAVMTMASQERVEQQLVGRRREAERGHRREPDARRVAQRYRGAEARPMQHDDREQRPRQLVPPPPDAIRNLPVQP